MVAREGRAPLIHVRHDARSGFTEVFSDVPGGPHMTLTAEEWAELTETIAAAERQRILLALLGCTGCGRIHELREVTSASGNPGGRDWRDPGDGHAYSAAWSTGPTPYARIRELLADPPEGGSA